ncbi:MAG: Wadjet anti-phage system protein JetA family protein [Culicoidibacterales bacterium]
MKNIFDTLPPNFFSIFASEYRRMMSDCIWLLMHQIEDDFSYVLARERAVSILDDYFENNHVYLDDSMPQVVRERSLYVLRRLRECGWISEERGVNFQIDVVFEDYAIVIFKTLSELNAEVSIEYSGYVFTIYQALRNFNPNEGAKIIERAYEDTRTLMLKLKALNANIKKYIQKIVDDKNKDDLKLLHDQLLYDYQAKIIDRAYHNLTTIDTPTKYRMDILQNLQMIEYNEPQLDVVVRKIMEMKDFAYDRALEHVKMQLGYMAHSFEIIEDVMEDINEKNRRYVDSAINRISFLLNTKGDLEGKLNRLIQGFAQDQVENTFIKVANNLVADEASLYKPRVYHEYQSSELAIPMLENVELLEQKAMALMKNNLFSKSSINQYVDQLLGAKDLLVASTMPFTHLTDFTYLIVIYLYGYSEKMGYVIEELAEVVTIDDVKFHDFIIRRKL